MVRFAMGSGSGAGACARIGQSCATPLPAQNLRTARRVAEQIWANVVYERAL